MKEEPFILSSLPQAILHIDGDAFFASCEQSRDPKLKGKPVITGKERGIASSMSYEAKELGVTRGMRLSEIKKIIPNAIILPSDYETYSLISQRFINIVRRYTPDVEEYGIDECFADITGMRHVLRMSYVKIAEKIKEDLEIELGFTFSIGLAPNKVLAKIGSKWKKPNGLTAIPGKEIHLFLAKTPIEKIWGIGQQTSSFLRKFAVTTALDFAEKQENWIRNNLSNPFYKIWQELNGKFVLPLKLEEKKTYYSIQKFKTFTPPSKNYEFILSQLSKNIENACIKARRYRLVAKKAAFFLRTQSFRDDRIEISLSHSTFFPNEIMQTAAAVFKEIYRPNIFYRATGISLFDFNDFFPIQQDLFNFHLHIEKMARMYKSVDEIKNKYGKHTLFLGSSFIAQKFGAHKGERGEYAERKKEIFKGENKRKRLGIPMLMVPV